MISYRFALLQRSLFWVIGLQLGEFNAATHRTLQAGQLVNDFGLVRSPVRFDIQDAAEILGRLRLGRIEVHLLKAEAVTEVEACGVIANRFPQLHDIRNREGMTAMQRVSHGIKKPRSF